MFMQQIPIFYFKMSSTEQSVEHFFYSMNLNALKFT